MVLEEHDPDTVPPGLEAEALMLAACAGLLQGQLKALHSISADVQSSFRLVDDLDLLA